jgi:sulfonate transport system substrate-binding protein
MNTFRLICRSIALLLTSAVLAVATANADPLQVRFGTGGQAVDYGPFYVARAKGFFDKALTPLNAAMTSVELPSPPVINEALATNKIDVMFVAELPVLIGRAAGIPTKIIAISCTLTQEIIVRPGQVSSVADLRGKKIAVLTGSSSHYGVIEILKKAGLSTRDVSILNMLPPDAKAAFETNQVDAWAVWPPFVEQEELAGKGVVLGGGTAQINSIVAVRGEFVADHRDIVQTIVNVVMQTKQWMIAHPEESQAIIAEAVTQPMAVIERAWPRHNWDARLDPVVIADIQAKADFLKSLGLIKNDVVVKDGFVDTSFQDNVK